jgi:hypothetical protein
LAVTGTDVLAGVGAGVVDFFCTGSTTVGAGVGSATFTGSGAGVTTIGVGAGVGAGGVAVGVLEKPDAVVVVAGATLVVVEARLLLSSSSASANALDCQIFVILAFLQNALRLASLEDNIYAKSHHVKTNMLHITMTLSRIFFNFMVAI